MPPVKGSIIIMQLFIRHAMTGLMAAMLLALFVSSAGARNFSTNEQGFSVRWPSLEWATAIGTIRCPVTLHGTFHRRTIVKTIGLLLGMINGATVNDAACTNGRATVLRGSLPWHFTYGGFAGTLPRITSVTVNVIGASFQASIEGTTCLARTDAAEPGRGRDLIGASGEARVLDADETSQLDLEDEEFICAIGGNSSFNGNGAIDGDIVEPIRVTLIA